MRKSYFAILGVLLVAVGCSSDKDSLDSSKPTSGSASELASASKAEGSSNSGERELPEMPTRKGGPGEHPAAASVPHLPGTDGIPDLPDLPPLPGQAGGPKLPELPPLPGEADGPLVPDMNGPHEQDGLPIPPSASHGEGDDAVVPRLPDVPEPPEEDGSIGPPIDALPPTPE